ncbi:MAG: type II toxin-antitoxin system VapC family toxin [Candidatus Levybacteria bacterium]|nr:type II toxin-antitoxin system VapC family toxin [Candidatus Levybacteria bacterium]
MKYLLDTDVIVDHLRKIKMLDEAIIASGAGISIITLAELFHGAYKSKTLEKSLTTIQEMLELLHLQIVNLDTTVVTEFGRMKAVLEKGGKRLEDFDLLIGACAKANGLMLVTRNLKHFARVQGLKVKN